MKNANLELYSSYKYLKLDRPQEGVLVVTMDRPEILNAINSDMHVELGKIWDDIGADDLTKIVVITGSGRAFSAGNDRKAPSPTIEQRLKHMNEVMKLTYGILNMEKPIISAIRGVAVGSGLQVGLLADIPIVDEDAVLFDGHLRVGIMPGDYAALLWPLLCGLAKAKYYLMTDIPITGKEAERLGMVAKALPADEVLPKALEIAGTLAAGPQYALRWTKRAVNTWLRSAAPIFEHSVALETIGVFTPDNAEANLAFSEKRPPVFPSASGE